MFNEKGFELILKKLKSLKNTLDVPIASVLCVDGIFYKPFVNLVYKHNNHLNHAEILAVTNTLKKINQIDFKNNNAVLYSSIEPCCMCFSFASLVRVSKIVFFAYDEKFGGSERIYTKNSAFTKPEILCIEKEEIKILMKNFFLNKR